MKIIERQRNIIQTVLDSDGVTKSKIKEATQAVAYIYDEMVAKARRDEILDIYKVSGRTEELENAYWGIPDLHNVKEKHKEFLGDFYPRAVELKELRDAIKAVPVVTLQKKEETVETTIRNLLKNKIETTAEKFDYAKFVMEEFAKMVFNDKLGKEVMLAPISVIPVYCMNYFGTSWVRFDWYLNGKKTSFNMIAAAVEDWKAKQ